MTGFNRKNYFSEKKHPEGKNIFKNTQQTVATFLDTIKEKAYKILEKKLPETLQTKRYIRRGSIAIGKIPLERRIPEDTNYSFGKTAIIFLERGTSEKNRDKLIQILYQIKSINPNIRFDSIFLDLLNETLNKNPNFELGSIQIQRKEATIYCFTQILIFFSENTNLQISSQEFYIFSKNPSFLHGFNYIEKTDKGFDSYIDSWRTFYMLVGEDTEACIDLIGPPPLSYGFIKDFIESGQSTTIFSEIFHLKKTCQFSKKLIDEEENICTKILKNKNTAPYPKDIFLKEISWLLQKYKSLLERFQVESYKVILDKKEDFIQGIYKEELKENDGVFNPEKAIEEIYHARGFDRPLLLEMWRNNYRTQLNLIASIIRKVTRLGEISKFGFSNQMLTMNNIVSGIKWELGHFSKKQKIRILKGIYTYISKIYSVERIIETAKYYQKPKKLLADIFDFSEEKFKGVIQMERKLGMLVFLIEDERDYQLLYRFGDDTTHENISASHSAGFATSYSAIPDLRGAVCVIKNTHKRSKKVLQEIITHEISHLLFPYLKQDTEDNNEPLIRAKDEIIAYLQDGTSLDDIRKYLIHGPKKGKYNYFTDILQKDRKRYKKLYRLYIYEVSLAIETAHYFKEAGIENYREILTITPIRSWSRLAKIYKVGIYSENPIISRNANESLNNVMNACLRESFSADWQKIMNNR